MKIAVFGDLSHVRNFGAQLTSECLKSDLVKSAPLDAEIRYFPMPTISSGESISRRHANRFLSKPARIKLRDMRARKFKKRSVEGHKNVHYNSLFDQEIPSALKEFNELEQGASIAIDWFSRVKNMVDWADFVYINGEGNIVNHTSKTSESYRIGARVLMIIAVLCSRAKVPFSLINCTVDPRHEVFEEVLRYYLPKAEFVTVREPISYKFCRDELKLQNVIQGVDASMGYVSEEARLISPSKPKKPHIVIGDSSGLTGRSENVRQHFFEIFDFFLKRNWSVSFFDGTSNYSYVLGGLANDMGVKWLSDHYLNYRTLQAELCDATLMFSGRWHPSIQAASCGIPIALYGSDSCKTKGLAEQLDMKFINGSLADIVENKSILEEIASIPSVQSKFSTIKRVSEISPLRLKNFLPS